MRIKAKRFFVSTICGNVDSGQILTLKDGYAKHLIGLGFAEEIPSAAPAVGPAVKKPDFQSPVEEKNRHGLLSPAAQVLRKRTATPLKRGRVKRQSFAKYAK